MPLTSPPTVSVRTVDPVVRSVDHCGFEPAQPTEQLSSLYAPIAGAGDVAGAVHVTIADSLPDVAVSVAGAAGGAMTICTGSTIDVVAGFAVMR